MRLQIGHRFEELLKIIFRYLILYGGRGSGKSEFAARKILWRCWFEGNHRFLIMRKVRSRLRESVIEVFLDLLAQQAIEFEYNKTIRSITFRSPTGINMLLFDGLDDPDKIKGIKGITGVWLEEATEFTARDFAIIDTSLREPIATYHQIMMTFNPDEARAPWIKEMFFTGKKPGHTGEGSKKNSFVHHSTIYDNPIDAVRENYVDQLIGLKDVVLRKIFLEGLWSLPKGIIYPDWDIVHLPSADPNWYDDIFYGGDFGYSVNPAALVRIFQKGDEFWLQLVIYEKNLTNAQLAQKMKDKGLTKTDVSYWDAAEPKSIDELVAEGINAKPSIKGERSVKTGIDFLKSKAIHIVYSEEIFPDKRTGSDIIDDERKTYKWMEDAMGNLLAKPTGLSYHALDAGRYGIYSHLRGRKRGALLWAKEDAY